MDGVTGGPGPTRPPPSCPGVRTVTTAVDTGTSTHRGRGGSPLESPRRPRSVTEMVGPLNSSWRGTGCVRWDLRQTPSSTRPGTPAPPDTSKDWSLRRTIRSETGCQSRRPTLNRAPPTVQVSGRRRGRTWCPRRPGRPRPPPGPDTSILLSAPSLSVHVPDSVSGGPSGRVTGRYGPRGDLGPPALGRGWRQTVCVLCGRSTPSWVGQGRDTGHRRVGRLRRVVVKLVRVGTLDPE